MRLGVARALSDGAIVDGDVDVEDARVAAIGVSPAGHSGTAVPGFVDIQINGFAGVDFAAAEPEDYATAGAALLATGVVAYQPTVITMTDTDTAAALANLARVQPDPFQPHIIGMHLEGPFLSPLRAGAHDPALMIDPDIATAEHWMNEGPVTMITIAPERPGALELIERVVGAGVAVACGHSDATAAEAHAAFDRGASVVTHLFNAQRPFTHREPGIAGAALSRSDVTVTLIADGVHLADEAVNLAFASPAAVAVITDAIAAAGRPDGTYPLGNRRVVVEGGSARLHDGTLAGSVLTMDTAVRNLVNLGIGLPDAVRAATATPAQAVDRSDLGSLTVGASADVVVLDDDLLVDRTFMAGEQVFPPS